MINLYMGVEPSTLQVICPQRTCWLTLMVPFFFLGWRMLQHHNRFDSGAIG